MASFEPTRLSLCIRKGEAASKQDRGGMYVTYFAWQESTSKILAKNAELEKQNRIYKKAFK